MRAPLYVSHRATVLSDEPDASSSPSSPTKIVHLTLPVWPTIACRCTLGTTKHSYSDRMEPMRGGTAG